MPNPKNTNHLRISIMNDLVTQFTWIIRSAKDANKLKKIEQQIKIAVGTIPPELIEEIKKKKLIQGNLF